MSNIKIIYSKEFEVQRVINSIKKLDWYLEHGYDKHLSFPQLLQKEELKNYSEEEIKDAVIGEYSGDFYKDYERFLLDNWQSISAEIDLAFSKSDLPKQEEYRIYFTKYGTGGSYDLPNSIIIRIKNQSPESVGATVIHEIIHLAIEGDIKKHGIGQREKERIVDLFFARNFTKQPPMKQKIYESMNTEKIDRVFDENFPNVKKAIESL